VRARKELRRVRARYINGAVLEEAMVVAMQWYQISVCILVLSFGSEEMDVLKLEVVWYL
jgi:hypothetical protein